MASFVSRAKSGTTPLLNTLSNLLAVLKSNGSQKSILPFVPRPLKWLFLLLLVLNTRSLPLAWHARVFVPLLNLRFKSIYFRRRGPTARLPWLTSVSPVGIDPFSLVTVIKTRAYIDDCDYNFHLNNASFAKNLDSARLKICMDGFTSFFTEGGWMGLGASHFSFVREIPMNSEYEMHIGIGGWGDKWISFVGYFVSYPKRGQKGKRQACVVEEVKMNGNAVLDVPSISVSSTPLSDNTPAPSSPSNESSSLPNMPFPGVAIIDPAAVVHCVSVSTYCFKIGRVTVPPRIALVTSGFGNPNKGRWERVQKMRKDNTIKDFLRGGWKTDEGNATGLWDLEECETRRVAGMHWLDKLGTSMHALKGQ
ncbi:hypothetical protein BOTBODRAFT_61344 [Botryobasidium botryosum FD-172 SS1]|uniref:Thioesterase domain-containing protein n=1 Tax=Botryobasidium botryosum (strain FD-172 SS1) TaxID=930990 RepID=A0A067N1G8_BOTB1|nr:hypothetical protein BOTBODRAFT_61344 [Botryobasidium botryosum FD-172 SS1]